MRRFRFERRDYSLILSISCIMMSEQAFIGSSSAHLISILVSPCSRRKCAPLEGGGGGGGIIMRSRGPPSLGPPSLGPQWPGGGGGGGASALGPAPGGGGGGGGASACWPASGAPPGGGGGGCWANVDPAARNSAAPAIISFFMRETSGVRQRKTNGLERHSVARDQK